MKKIMPTPTDTKKISVCQNILNKPSEYKKDDLRVGQAS